MNLPVVPTFPTPSQILAHSTPHLLLLPAPDNISSHEKKRHYLECLEHYIVYLHDQLIRLAVQPPDLHRTAPSPIPRGMSSKSIRTLLVHMQHLNHQLNQQTISEEHRFMALRDVLSRCQY